MSFRNLRLGQVVAAVVAASLVAGGLAACSKRDNGDRLSDNQVVASNVETNAAKVAKVADPAKRCASGPTFELLKRELFRRAALLRGNGDPALFDRIATAAALRIERPVVTSSDEGLGSVACSASASIDLPPGLAVAGGRTSLTTDLDYTLQPAAGGGGGDVLSITNADPIIVPLATIERSAPARTSEPGSADAASPTTPQPDPLAPVAVHRPPLVTPSLPTPSRPGGVRAQPRPSFSCASARTSGEMAICQDPGLAAIDRQMSAQYRDAYAAASPAARETLQTTARRFYGFRDNCPDARCIASGYRERMREIDDIMDHDR